MGWFLLHVKVIHAVGPAYGYGEDSFREGDRLLGGAYTAAMACASGQRSNAGADGEKEHAAGSTRIGGKHTSDPHHCLISMGVYLRGCLWLRRGDGVCGICVALGRDLPRCAAA